MSHSSSKHISTSSGPSSTRAIRTSTQGQRTSASNATANGSPPKHSVIIVLPPQVLPPKVVSFPSHRTAVPLAPVLLNKSSSSSPPRRARAVTLEMIPPQSQNRAEQIAVPTHGGSSSSRATKAPRARSTSMTSDHRDDHVSSRSSSRAPRSGASGSGSISRHHHHSSDDRRSPSSARSTTTTRYTYSIVPVAHSTSVPATLATPGVLNAAIPNPGKGALGGGSFEPSYYPRAGRATSGGVAPAQPVSDEYWSHPAVRAYEMEKAADQARWNRRMQRERESRLRATSTAAAHNGPVVTTQPLHYMLTPIPVLVPTNSSSSTTSSGGVEYHHGQRW